METIIITAILGIIGVFMSGVAIGISYSSHEYTKTLLNKLQEEIEDEIQS